MSLLLPVATRPRLPGSCLICGRACCRHYCICSYCEASLPRVQNHCHGCGLGFPGNALHENRCGRCHARQEFDYCFPAFPYTSPVDRLLTAFKFRGQFAAGFALSRIMADRLLQESGKRPLPELLLPVPLHRSRLRQRGFNQAWEICRVLSRQLAIAAKPRLLQKHRHTAAQAELSASRRRRNLRGAFSVANPVHLQDVNRVAIVDDVVTTMSTARELHRLLTGHGIRAIELWCLARAGERPVRM